MIISKIKVFKLIKKKIRQLKKFNQALTRNKENQEFLHLLHLLQDQTKIKQHKRKIVQFPFSNQNSYKTKDQLLKSKNNKFRKSMKK